MSKGQNILDAVTHGAYQALGVSHEEANRFYLRKVEEQRMEIERLTKERDQARMAEHRLRTEISAVDLHHIRLRSGLREALDWIAALKPVMGREAIETYKRLRGLVL